MADGGKKKTTREPGVIETLSSLQFALVVLIAIAVVAVVGTVIPQGNPPDLYRDMYGGALSFIIGLFRFDRTYSSPLFLGLLALFGVNLTLCSLMRFPAIFRRAFSPDKLLDPSRISGLPVSFKVKNRSAADIAGALDSHRFHLDEVAAGRYFGEKGRLGHLGAFTVHLSLVMLLVGGLVSLLTGFRGYIQLSRGESADVAVIAGDRTMPLGFTVTLNSFDVSFYENFPNRPKSYVSAVTVTLPDGSTFDRDIRVNSPLMRNSFTVYQSSYGIDNSREHAQSDADTAMVELRLAGSPDSMPPVTTLALKLGDTETVPGFGDSVAVRVSELYRSFTMGSDSSGSRNPALKLDIIVVGETRWSVFAFKNYPSLNMPMYDDVLFHVTLKDIREDFSTGASGETESEYYTILGVVRDRGIPIMWAAAVLMAVGLTLSFYVRPRRIWMAVGDGVVFIGGSAKGDETSFRRFVGKTIDSAPKRGVN